MRVTVGISFFNNEATLEDAIRSVFAQTYQNWELILINDGSTDGSLAIAESLTDPRVRVFSDGENRGAPCRLNEIAELARGEFIARMDGDDIMHPDRLALQVACLDANPGVDVLSNGIYIIDAQNNPIGVRCLDPLDASPEAALKRGILVQGSAMGRTEWWRRFPYDASYRRAEENELWCRSCLNSRFGKISQPLYFCREQSKRPAAYLRDYLQSGRTLRRIYRNYGPSFVGWRQTITLIAQSWLKGVVYRAATYLGMQRQLINRRNRRLSAEENAIADESLRTVMQTNVPGLPTKPVRGGELRLCRVVTTPYTFVALLRNQISTIADSGIDCTLVSSPGEELDQISRESAAANRTIEMSREINVARDFMSLIRLYRLFKSERFDIVHSSTAKAGLLASVAAWLARTPVRIHTFTGQRWVELQGFRRRVVKASDKIVATLSTDCYADSESQRQFLIDERLVRPSKISVLASGSISGVDLDRFNPELPDNARRELGIDEAAVVILFVGRVNRDKGIIELVSAFKKLSDESELVLVGPFEPDLDPLPQDVIDELTSNHRIHLIGHTPQPERYMAAADILCLPSYREGFGSVVIEAAAMGLPAVATSIIGLIDAVEAGNTGILATPKNVESLHKALSIMVEDRQLRERMGRAARERAERLFDARIVNQAIADEYHRLHQRRPAPAQAMRRQTE